MASTQRALSSPRRRRAVARRTLRRKPRFRRLDGESQEYVVDQLSAFDVKTFITIMVLIALGAWGFEQIINILYPVDIESIREKKDEIRKIIESGDAQGFTQQTVENHWQEIKKELAPVMEQVARQKWFGYGGEHRRRFEEVLNDKNRTTDNGRILNHLFAIKDQLVTWKDAGEALSAQQFWQDIHTINNEIVHASNWFEGKREGVMHLFRGVNIFHLTRQGLQQGMGRFEAQRRTLSEIAAMVNGIFHVVLKILRLAKKTVGTGRMEIDG